jgi:D-alanyl-D-alanine carboxypeptidase
MIRSAAEKIASERKYVIMFQLLILAFILTGIFGTFFIGPNDATIPAATVESQPLSDQQSTALVPQKIKDVTVRARAAYVFDVTNQRVLYAKNETEVLPLASITKLMTALLVDEISTAKTPAIVSQRAVLQDGSNGLVEGEELSMENLNKLALISSSNDAAYAMGDNVGGLLGDRDSMAQFVAAMNIRAEELGFASLSFKNPTGLDETLSAPGAVGSAKDVSFLLEYMLKNHRSVVEPTRQYNARVYNTSGEFHDMSNTNDVLYGIPNLLASKTGYTDLAGGNLTIAFDAGLNRPIIITVLGSTREERFSDVLRLVDAVQSNFSSQ